MLAHTVSAITQGLEPIKIDVEVHGAIGTPNLLIIGLPNKTIEEARERITAAITNCGLRIQAKRVVVNLAPADVYKDSSALELPMAVGILTMYGELPPIQGETWLFGELSLTGELKPIRGALPLVLAAAEAGVQRVVIPQANASEVAVVSGVNIFPVGHLQDVLQLIKTSFHAPSLPNAAFTPSQYSGHSEFAHIRGQYQAKRALEIAAVGEHAVLLVGPPGAGKSMLCHAFASIMPPLTQAEAVAVTQIYSVKGLTKAEGLITTRPFRNPHHTTSLAGLIGGGTKLLPGEISLASEGVLFLDELPEFSRNCLEALRQPLEDKRVVIARANGSVIYPADFQLLAAANPCACGYFGSRKKACSCSLHQRTTYLKRLSGPILDRIEMHVNVAEVETADLHSNQSLSESSAQIRQRIEAARTFAQERILNETSILSMTDAAERLLLTATTKLGLSARSFYKVKQVARSIADLDQNAVITPEHIAEALQFRPQQ